LFSIPLFGSQNFPAVAKVGLSLLISWVIFPSVPPTGIIKTAQWLQLVPAIIAEIMIGIVIGFTARMFFEGIQLGGQLVGFQMGFGIVNVIDPVSGANFSVIAQFQNLLATLFFIALNMHHVFFNAIALSFKKIPVFHCSLSTPLWEWLIDLSSNIFLVAVKVGAPVIAILLFTSVALGIIAKSVPQINIFIVGFPIKIAAGLIGLGITLPMFFIVLKKIFSHFDEYIFIILKAGALPS